MSKLFRVVGNIYIIGSAEISHPYDCCAYLIDVGELILVDSGAGRSFNRLGLTKMPCSQISGTTYEPNVVKFLKVINRANTKLLNEF